MATTTLKQVFDSLAAFLVAEGFEFKTQTASSSVECTYHFAAAGVNVAVTCEGRIGVVELVSARIEEMDPYGFPTGVEHKFSHVTPRTAPLLAVFAAALVD